jgi:hypothetical protein
VYARGPVSLGGRCAWYAVLLAATVACQRWQLDSSALTTPQPDRRQLEIWSQGRSTVVHGLRVQGDSVVGVPYWKPLDCDSCAVRFARGQVDSVRVQAPDNVRSTASLAAGVMIFAVVLWRYRGLLGPTD